MTLRATAETEPQPNLFNSTNERPSFEELAGQYRTALATITETLQNVEAVSKQNAETIAARLDSFERSLTAERHGELQVVARYHRAAVMTSASIGVVGVLGMGVGVLIMARLTCRQTPRAGPSELSPCPTNDYSVPMLDGGDLEVTSVGAAEESRTLFRGALEILRGRVQQIENTETNSSGADQGDVACTKVLCSTLGKKLQAVGSSGLASRAPNESSRIALRLGKGLALLKLNRHEDAIACFDEVLALDPTNIDALIQKGQALEGLQCMKEALETYDRVISADHSSTLGYLFKGGLYNRLERCQGAVKTSHERADVNSKPAILR